MTAQILTQKSEKLVHGIGRNDAGYTISQQINGKMVLCPYYRKWSNMLERCYSDKLQARLPTYIGCTVTPEWHSFKAFRSWMIEQDWKDKELDKDLIVSGNKVYSPETCLFVTRAINALLNDSAAIRGQYPQGVSRHEQGKKYQACIKKYGKTNYLGLFNTVAEAEAVYKKAKAEHVYEIALQQTGKLRQALLRKLK